MEKLVVGDHRFLRNDYPCEIEVGGIKYPTVEHAFQAVKLLDRKQQESIATSCLSDAMSIGRDRNNEIWDDWDDGRSLRVMEFLVRQKFFTSEELEDQLVETGGKPIEMQRPGDSYWGVGDDGDGENHLGQILMHVRDELQMLRGWKPPEKKEPQPGDWIRDLRYEDNALDDETFNALVELYEKCKSDVIPFISTLDQMDGIISDIRGLVEKIDATNAEDVDDETGDDDEEEDYDSDLTFG